VSGHKKMKRMQKKRLKTESKRDSKAENYTEDKRFCDQLDRRMIFLIRWWNFTGFS
jgi:hypothetical protein